MAKTELRAVKVVLPVPACCTAPVPEIAPEKVTASDLLKARPELSITLPAIDPVVPPLPSCRMPLLMVVPPL